MDPSAPKINVKNYFFLIVVAFMAVSVGLSAYITQTPTTLLSQAATSGPSPSPLPSVLHSPTPTPVVISTFTPTSGTINATITISGSGFGEEKGKVTIGEATPVQATVTLWSDTQVKIKIAAKTKTGSLKLTTADGREDVSSIPFTLSTKSTKTK